MGLIFFFLNLFPNSVFTRILKGFLGPYLTHTHIEAKRIKEDNVP